MRRRRRHSSAPEAGSPGLDRRALRRLLNTLARPFISRPRREGSRPSPAQSAVQLQGRIRRENIDTR